jgi:hypothetical protein
MLFNHGQEATSPKDSVEPIAWLGGVCWPALDLHNWPQAPLVTGDQSQIRRLADDRGVRDQSHEKVPGSAALSFLVDHGSQDDLTL